MTSASQQQGLIRRGVSALLVGTVLGGAITPALAQQPAQQAPQPQVAAPVPLVAPAAARTIRSISVRGAERIEPETVQSYSNLTPGQAYNAEILDAALKALYATELFADVEISGADTGDLVIAIRENPVINRIVLEGNKRIKDDKILPEIKLAPRQIFTRSKVRADVERIVELYRRQGRFAASVEPKIVTLDQNRVDLIFEISEGEQSKVRAINFIGNKHFGDKRLAKEMYTKRSGGLLGFMKSNDTYDPDRLAADQQNLRAFYLTQGYADFRVVSALAELTPDRRDFIITYVVEEGNRYRLGKIEAESELRDLTAAKIKSMVNLKPGTWFNAKAVEDSVTSLNELAGVLGYAFADISPSYERNAEKRVMDIIFKVAETPRVYVERVDINGNTVTRDKVIRREFRLNEGDAYNSVKVKRTQDRIQSLGYFQDKLEIKQTQGAAPDRVVLDVDVEERSTGELQVSAGYSSLEKFLVALSITQRNFMGKGQELNAGVNYSRYSKSVQLGFTEPYFLDRAILLGGEIYRRDYSSFNFVNDERNTTYSQVSTGGGLKLGFPVTEFVSFGGRYNLVLDDVSLDKGSFFTAGECDPLRAGRYLCDELGKHTTSSIGYSLAFDNTNGVRATRGQRLVLSQDFAGLGGDVKYLRSRAEGTKYRGLRPGFILSGHLQGGYIHPLQKSKGPGRDAVRLTDRFFGPQMRGFDIRGIGPRIVRRQYDISGALAEGGENVDDALGGRAYYMGRVELEFPLGSGARDLGLRPSAFVDFGSVFALKKPETLDVPFYCLPAADNTTPGVPNADCTTPGFVRIPGYREEYLGDSIKPRLSVGVGVNWTSPFGPLRIDVAKALLKQKGDVTKFFSFNVGTSF